MTASEIIVKKKAYAKINLTLEILGTRRGDGYHDISSVMHKIPLCDELEISVNTLSDENKVNLRTLGNKIDCEIKDNLAYKAADAYLEKYSQKTGKHVEIFIELTKKIPSGAGLAGGSADASAVIGGLYDALGTLCEKELFDIALSLGSDVPFCLAKSKCALCTGRGEIMSELPPLENAFLSVIFPSEPLITKGIYAQYDGENADDYSKDLSDKTARALKTGAGAHEILSFMTNDFQNICEKKCAGIKKARESLSQDGARAMMTGSGSAVFGIFTDEKAYEKSAGNTYGKNFIRFDLGNLSDF